MKLKRKIEQLLAEWKAQPKRKPLMVRGCRQCGKTFSVLEFAHANYEHIVYLNFFSQPEYRSFFAGSLNVDDIVMKMSPLFGGTRAFLPGKTIIVLDEIQECPQARTALKFFHLDGRFDVIATGSLLGVKGYRETPASIPIGSEATIEMFPLSFEEFLWANNVSPEIIGRVQKCIEDEKAVDAAFHLRLRELFLQYAVVGGMPEAVTSFLENKRLDLVYEVQSQIMQMYKDDMIKYADQADKGKIVECFESIPAQLAKENKKFQYSVVRKKGSSSKYEGSLQWIEAAGLIKRCYNLSVLDIPFVAHVKRDVFKVYMCDCGLFVSMLDRETVSAILNGDLKRYKGAVFENLIADVFIKMGRKLYYYHKDSGLEIDFVMCYKGQATLVEVKATSGDAKSVKTILGNYETYGVQQAIKLGDYNVGRAGQILTLPLYSAFLLVPHRLGR